VTPVCESGGGRFLEVCTVLTCSAPGTAEGYAAIDALLAAAVVMTMMAVSVPLTADATDAIRTGMAARYLEGRVMDARMHAVRRAARVALRFEPEGADYRFAEYADGNANGVRSAEISAGIDPELTPAERLRDRFTAVRFGLMAGIPDLDGTSSAMDGDGVRIGTSRILTLGADGTATSGTIYLHGRRVQYAVRILGATGRTRVLYFDTGANQWITR
jgi:hypothetical protein